MIHRHAMPIQCNHTVLEDNPLLSLFDQIEAQQRDSGQRFCCVHCRAAITTEKDKMEVNSTHAFHVSNPSGFSFNVVCFKEAWGCGVYGEPTDMYTWFPGYCWQYAYCLNCEEHLGWYYENTSEQHFFGLIAEKLVLTGQQ